MGEKIPNPCGDAFDEWYTQNKSLLESTDTYNTAMKGFVVGWIEALKSAEHKWVEQHYGAETTAGPTGRVEVAAERRPIGEIEWLDDDEEESCVSCDSDVTEGGHIECDLCHQPGCPRCLVSWDDCVEGSDVPSSIKSPGG